MYGSISELLAADPSFRIRGGASQYAEPVMPGEQRLLPYLQRPSQGAPSPALPGSTNALPPVRSAYGLPVDPDDFLVSYLQSNLLT
jgi:hypothetical protein